jgi:tRNA threonylcarbamoyladenosine dehydratase
MSRSMTAAITGAVVGATVTAALSYLLTTTKQQPKSKKNNSSANGKSKIISIPPELRDEQLSRHTLYFGEDGIQSIRSAKVCVVGLGGVGSHTAIMLARGGVEMLRLIDFDQVTLSSLNRHACATLEDVGIPKVTAVQNTCHKLGVTNVDARNEMFTKDSASKLLDDVEWDIIIDCIDDVKTKSSLLSYCIRRNIRTLSCMGAGGKSDMTRLHVSDLRTSAKDPLASKLRMTLKKEMEDFESKEWLDDMDQLTIIWCSEVTVAKLADFTDEQKAQADKNEFGAVDGFRIRVLPVLGPLPAIMGQSLASITLCTLGNKPLAQPVTGERVSKNVRHKLFQHLTNREAKIRKGELHGDKEGIYKGQLEVDMDDMEYLLGVWRNRCAVSGARLGAILSVVRWDLNKPAATDNLVVMAAPALKKFDEEGIASVPENVCQRIETRLAACRDPNNEVF